MRRFHSIALPVASLALALLSGCIVGPTYSGPSAALNNERNHIDIMRRRIKASVALIKAVGGGRDTSATTLRRNYGTQGFH